MLFDTSIKDKKTKTTINGLVGKPFNIVDILKMGTIGSSRMQIVSYSKLFNKAMAWDKQAVFANIALRPKGVIVVINVRLCNYSWVIPYHYLSIFKSDLLSIHSQGEFIKFKADGDQKKQFLNKIIEKKQAYLNQ